MPKPIPPKHQRRGCFLLPRCLTTGPWWRCILCWILTLILCLALYVAAVLTNFLWLFGKSPSLDDIMHPRNPEASEVYSADNKLLGKIYKENRTNVPFEEINPVFFDALIATEDERFYEHYGIDFRGMGGAAKDALLGRPRGASTITQQLVKNMFRMRSKYSTGLLGKVPGLRIFIMKSKEMIIATEIELTNSKTDILQMYANTVDFGSNSYGIKAAAKTFFNTTPAKLKTEECAVLVGLLKATSTYSPRLHPERSLARRNTVLDNMERCGYLTPAECESLKAKPLKLNFTAADVYEGQAHYFREAVARDLMDHCPELDPYVDGLKIYTTLDSRMQQYAEQAVLAHMRSAQANFNAEWGNAEPWRGAGGRVMSGFPDTIAKRTEAYQMLRARYPDSPDSVRYYMNRPHQVKVFSYNGPQTRTMSSMDSLRYMLRFLHCGFVAMEPGTGHVKAWVGDIDFRTWKYDKVTAQRQPGSTFKLFVYTAAMERGLRPDDRYPDSPISIPLGGGKTWTPKNAGGHFSNEDLPLHTAFARSVNSVAAKLGQDVGIPKVMITAKDMGIRSPLDDTPALALGASDVNLLELVSGYATIANGGQYTEPVLVTKVYTADGHLVYEAEPKTRRAVSETSAYYMQTLLQGGLTEAGGTSRRLQEYIGAYLAGGSLDAGGKTGTTNNNSDAWFVGVTPGLVCGTWVGGEYRSIHFRSGAAGQGSRLALPVVGAFLARTLADGRLARKYLRRFTPPAGLADESPFGSYAPDSLAADSLAADSNAVFGGIWYEGENAEMSDGSSDNPPAEMPAHNRHDAYTSPEPPRPQQREPRRNPHEGEEFFE